MVATKKRPKKTKRAGAGSKKTAGAKTAGAKTARKRTATPERTRSPYLTVRTSAIHNKGGFAKIDIPKGTRIIEYVGDKITKAESDRRAEKVLERSRKNNQKGAVYVCVLNSRYDIDGNVSYNTAKYINHSCDPNCELLSIRGHMWIVARRNIKAGEELSYNYGYDYDTCKNHKCRCGSPKCIGYILARDQWYKLRRDRAKRAAARAEARARRKLPTLLN